MPPGEITLLLQEYRAGRREALNRLLPLVYEQLRVIARGAYRRQTGVTLTPTALVHEAYLKLFESAAATPQDRGHFFAVAAMAMRQIAVDHARRRQAIKRGGDLQRVDIDVDALASEPPETVLAVDEALERLGRVDPALVRIVELRYFAGLSIEETAHALGRSPMTIKRGWRMARVLLYEHLAADDAP